MLNNTQERQKICTEKCVADIIVETLIENGITNAFSVIGG